MQIIDLPLPERTVIDQLRSRWLSAIFQVGPVAARNDAVAVFMERMHCSHNAAEQMVDRAWLMLNLDVHTLGIAA